MNYPSIKNSKKNIQLKCSKEGTVETFLLPCIRKVTFTGINQYHENVCSASINRYTMENESTLYKSKEMKSCWAYKYTNRRTCFYHIRICRRHLFLWLSAFISNKIAKRLIILCSLFLNFSTEQTHKIRRRWEWRPSSACTSTQSYQSDKFGLFHILASSYYLLPNLLCFECVLAWEFLNRQTQMKPCHFNEEKLVRLSVPVRSGIS